VINPSPNVTGREYRQVSITATQLGIDFSSSLEVYDGVVPSNAWKLAGLTNSDSVRTTTTTTITGVND